MLTLLLTVVKMELILSPHPPLGKSYQDCVERDISESKKSHEVTPGPCHQPRKHLTELSPSLGRGHVPKQINIDQSNSRSTLVKVPGSVRIIRGIPAPTSPLAINYSQVTSSLPAQSTPCRCHCGLRPSASPRIEIPLPKSVWKAILPFNFSPPAMQAAAEQLSSNVHHSLQPSPDCGPISPGQGSTFCSCARNA